MSEEAKLVPKLEPKPAPKPEPERPKTENQKALTPQLVVGNKPFIIALDPISKQYFLNKTVEECLRHIKGKENQPVKMKNLDPELEKLVTDKKSLKLLQKAVMEIQKDGKKPVPIAAVIQKFKELHKKEEQKLGKEKPKYVTIGKVVSNTTGEAKSVEMRTDGKKLVEGSARFTLKPESSSSNAAPIIGYTADPLQKNYAPTPGKQQEQQQHASIAPAPATAAPSWFKKTITKNQLDKEEQALAAAKPKSSSPFDIKPPVPPA